MAEAIPEFLARPSYSPPASDVGDLTTFSFDYDYSKLPKQNPKSLFQNIIDTTDSGVSQVFDRVSGAWTSVKDSVSETVAAPFTIGEKILDGVKTYALYLFIGAIVLIYVLGKSGIFKLVAVV